MEKATTGKGDSVMVTSYLIAHCLASAIARIKKEDAMYEVTNSEKNNGKLDFGTCLTCRENFDADLLNECEWCGEPVCDDCLDEHRHPEALDRLETIL